MTQGLGSESWISLKKQGSYKTPGVPDVSFGFLSESFVFDSPPIIPQNLHAGRYEESGQSYPGPRSVAGAINCECDPVAVGYQMHGALGFSSATVVLSGTVFQHDMSGVQAAFNVDCAIVPYTYEVYRGVNSSFLIEDTVCNNMQLSMNVDNNIMMCTGNFMGRVHGLYNPVTPTYLENDPSFTFDACSISMAGGAIAEIRNWTFNVDNKFATVRNLNGSKEINRIIRDPGAREFLFSGVMDFTSQDEYNKFASNSLQAVVITCKGATAISSGYYPTAKLDMPRFNYQTYQMNISDAGQITAAFSGKALFDTSRGLPFQFTLTNSLATY